jgi:hypothetical protein
VTLSAETLNERNVQLFIWIATTVSQAPIRSALAHNAASENPNEPPLLKATRAASANSRASAINNEMRISFLPEGCGRQRSLLVLFRAGVSLLFRQLLVASIGLLFVSLEQGCHSRRHPRQSRSYLARFRHRARSTQEVAKSAS